MTNITYGLTGLSHVQSISAVTHEVSHLPGVTGVTIKVEPQGISLLTVTGTSMPTEAAMSDALEAVGCQLQPLAAA